MPKVYCNPIITPDDIARNAILTAQSLAQRIENERKRDIQRAERRIRERIEAQRFAQEVG